MVKKYFTKIALASAMIFGSVFAASAIDYSVSPKSPIVEELSEVTFTFSGAVTENNFNTTISNGSENFRVSTTAEGSTYVVTAIPAIKTIGSYIVTIPAGTISIDGVATDEAITMQYIVSPDDTYTTEITPAPGKVSELNEITITFDGAQACAYTASSIETSAYIVNAKSGDRITTYSSFNAPTISGNVMTFYVDKAIELSAGEYEFIMPAGSYTVDGIEGDPISAKYEVSPITYSVSPMSPIVEELSKIVITFNDITEVKEIKYDGVSVKNQYGEAVRYTTVAHDNVFEINITKPEEITTGIYVIYIAAGTLELDGQVYEENIVLQKSVELPLPEFSDEITPAQGIVSILDNFTIVFGGEDVEIALTSEQNTSLLPYISDANGNIVRRALTNFTIENNIVNFSISPLNEAGNYTLTIPGAFYIVNGITGVDLVYSYTIKEAPEFAVFPKQQVITETPVVFAVQFAQGAVIEEITYGTNVKNAATGEIVRCHTSIDNNMFKIEVIGELTDGQSYTFTIPAGSLKVNGEIVGVEITNTYLYSPEMAEVTFTANPESGSTVSTIQTIDITIEGVETVTPIVDSTENAPYIETAEGTRLTTLSPFSGSFTAEGNVLTLAFNEPITEAGTYNVVIPATAYKVNGAETIEIILSYTIDGTQDSISEINAAAANANVIFDLQGRRVAKASKGIFIINGVKTLVK